MKWTIRYFGEKDLSQETQKQRQYQLYATV